MSVWIEITVVGAEKLLRAYLAGFLAGRGSHRAVLLGDDLGIRPGTLADRVHGALGGATHLVLLAPEDLAVPLVAALRRDAGDLDLHLAGCARVMSATVAFTAQVYTRELAARVRSVLRDALPPGVSLERFAETESVEPDARGPELYAPAHEYTCHTDGEAAGTLEGVLEMRRRTLELELVTVEPIALQTEPISFPAN
jgi:hypothetical protein